MIIKQLGRCDYKDIYQQMQHFTKNRNDTTDDELWIVEFESVFTTGISNQDIYPNSLMHIPVINTNRGGQITYHGLGQIVIYLLIDIKRLGFGIKKFINIVEKSIIMLLEHYEISAHTRESMPGVYVDNKKIASLGLKITKKGSYHGISLNVDMNLSPFDYINTCGYKNLQVCQMKDFITDIDTTKQEFIALELANYLKKHLRV